MKENVALSSDTTVSGPEGNTVPKVLSWFVAIPLFVAGVMTALLEFNITASAPSEADGNTDLVEGTLAFFRNETARWPQEAATLILFTIGFLSLIGLVVFLKRSLGDSPKVLLGTCAIVVGAAFGAMAQILYIGVKELAIDPHYCDCPRLAEQVISRGQILGLFGNVQRWMLVVFLFLSTVGLLLIWREAREWSFQLASWRRTTVALAMALMMGTVALVVQFSILADVFTALGGSLLAPVWALLTARQIGLSNSTADAIDT